MSSSSRRLSTPSLSTGPPRAPLTHPLSASTSTLSPRRSSLAEPYAAYAVAGSYTFRPTVPSPERARAPPSDDDAADLSALLANPWAAQRPRVHPPPLGAETAEQKQCHECRCSGHIPCTACASVAATGGRPVQCRYPPTAPAGEADTVSSDVKEGLRIAGSTGPARKRGAKKRSSLPYALTGRRASEASNAGPADNATHVPRQSLSALSWRPTLPERYPVEIHDDLLTRASRQDSAQWQAPATSRDEQQLARPVSNDAAQPAGQVLPAGYGPPDPTTDLAYPAGFATYPASFDAAAPQAVPAFAIPPAFHPRLRAPPFEPHLYAALDTTRQIGSAAANNINFIDPFGTILVASQHQLPYVDVSPRQATQPLDFDIAFGDKHPGVRNPDVNATVQSSGEPWLGATLGHDAAPVSRFESSFQAVIPQPAVANRGAGPSSSVISGWPPPAQWGPDTVPAEYAASADHSNTTLGQPLVSASTWAPAQQSSAWTQVNGVVPGLPTAATSSIASDPTNASVHNAWLSLAPTWQVAPAAAGQSTGDPWPFHLATSMLAEQPAAASAVDVGPHATWETAEGNFEQLPPLAPAAHAASVFVADEVGLFAPVPSASGSGVNVAPTNAGLGLDLSAPPAMSFDMPSFPSDAVMPSLANPSSSAADSSTPMTTRAAPLVVPRVSTHPPPRPEPVKHNFGELPSPGPDGFVDEAVDLAVVDGSGELKVDEARLGQRYDWISARIRDRIERDKPEIMARRRRLGLPVLDRIAPGG